MKRYLNLMGIACWAVFGLAQANASDNPPPPVYPAQPAAPTPGQVYVYDQKPVAPPAGNTRTYLLAPDQAQSIIDRFKEAYKTLGNPRVVIYVNRNLVDEGTGLTLTSHRRVVETTRAIGEEAASNQVPAVAKDGSGRQIQRVSSTNIYRLRDPKEVPLSDKQTMRDIERLFGRPLRMAGVQLADQRIAAQLIGSKPLDASSIEAGNEQARKDREVLSKVADIALEILVSSKDTTVSEPTGDRTYPAPDIQATAIRLSDAKILGQATAADLIGQGASAAKAMATYGMREIAEATALSLMEDMMLH